MTTEPLPLPIPEPTAKGRLETAPIGRRATDLARVYVWQIPVRVTHWLIAFSIVVLAATGLYIGRPFLIVTGPAGQHFVMGWARLIHAYTAFVFILAVLARIAWMFLGNRYARWDKFIPVPARRRRGLWPTLKFYLFVLRKPPGFVGHNPLAGLTYALVYLLCLMMIGTGLALRSASAGSYMKFFDFLVPLFGGLQTARWLHHVGMWLLLGFAVHHVYSAILMAQAEQNATMESIFSGYKFVPREDLIYSGYRFRERPAVPPRAPAAAPLEEPGD